MPLLRAGHNGGWRRLSLGWRLGAVKELRSKKVIFSCEKITFYRGLF